ncbi:MAG TPA: class II fructose-bisphosphate aldolase [Chthonomonadales bacterium]|nr:class II fructose-bisphosphate aldolase [Chthonomonadales bacterium]
MPLVDTAAMLRAERAAGRAVGAFEPYNLEQIEAVLEAAEAESAPVIVQLWSEVLETFGFPALCAAIRELARRSPVPIAVHLDHATDDELIDGALEAGFQSVMFDGSRLPYEENVERTRDVVRRARPYGAAVEAELGIIGNIAEYASEEEAQDAVRKLLTTPEQAAEFVRATGVDILAPAVGSIHGCKLPFARLDLPRIRAIVEATGVPVALHGGSGVGEEQVRAAVGAGVAKVNVDAEVRTLAIAALRDAAGRIGHEENDWVDYARAPRAIKAVTRDAVRARIRLLRA